MIAHHRSAASAAAVFLFVFGLTVLLQFLSGAFHSEFAGYPDESAHYVTGLMVRNYLASLHYSSPMEFAAGYAAAYPKVAIGHWPPLLYIVEALWMLLFSASRLSVLMLLAFLTSTVAAVLYWAAKQHFGSRAAALAAVFFVCVPLIQVYAAEVMAESLLTLVTFLAVIFFARYLRTERWQDSLSFGLFASLAILTKGSGLDLAIVPPVAIILTRQYALLRRPSLWLPAILVAMLCGPWQILTLPLAERGWQGGTRPSLNYMFGAMWEFLRVYRDLFGWGLALLVLTGIAITVVVPYFQSAVKPEWAAMFALLFAAWLFHCLVPAGVEPRKLIVAVPAMVLFLFAGGEWVAKRLRWNAAVVAALAIAVFAVQGFSIPKEIHHGYIEAADFVSLQPDLPRAVILVSSEHDGEGMLISELAMRGSKRAASGPLQILRATKVLAKTDWNGKVSEDFFPSTGALLGYLKAAKVTLLVTDTLPPAISFAFQNNVREMLKTDPDLFQLMGKFTGQLPGAVYVYRVL